MQAISDTPSRIMRLIDVHPFILRRSNTMYQPPQNPDEPKYTPPQQPSYPPPPQGYSPQQPYYPPPPMQQPPKRKRRLWLWIIGILVVLAIIGSFASRGGTTN